MQAHCDGQYNDHFYKVIYTGIYKCIFLGDYILVFIAKFFLLLLFVSPWRSIMCWQKRKLFQFYYKHSYSKINNLPYLINDENPIKT